MLVLTYDLEPKSFYIEMDKSDITISDSQTKVKLSKSFIKKFNIMKKIANDYDFGKEFACSEELHRRANGMRISELALDNLQKMAGK